MIRAFFSFVRLAKVILLTNKKKTNQLYIELNEVLKPYGYNLTDNQKKRIWFYTAQSAITNHWFSQLREFSPTAAEVKNALYLGAFNPIADDLMDENKITFEELKNIDIESSSNAILYQYLYNKLRPLQLNNKLFNAYFKKAHLAQNESLKQLDRKLLTNDELKEISCNKGGFYTMLYRTILENKPVAGEEEAIYTLGSILQLLNDLFDLHKDFHNSVQTLATNTADIHFMRSELENLEFTFKEQFLALEYPKSAIRKSYTSIMAIVTRGHVALDYYEKLQGDDSNLKIEEYERKPLIVDMEKPKNIWLNLKFAARATRSL